MGQDGTRTVGGRHHPPRDIIYFRIANNVTCVDDRLFGGCTTIRTIEFPPSLEGIAADTFAECTTLEAITLPATIKRIKPGAFDGCVSLTSIKFVDMAKKKKKKNHRQQDDVDLEPKHHHQHCNFYAMPIEEDSHSYLTRRSTNRILHRYGRYNKIWSTR